MYFAFESTPIPTDGVMAETAHKLLEGGDVFIVLFPFSIEALPHSPEAPR